MFGEIFKRIFSTIFQEFLTPNNVKNCHSYYQRQITLNKLLSQMFNSILAQSQSQMKIVVFFNWVTAISLSYYSNKIYQFYKLTGQTVYQGIVSVKIKCQSGFSSFAKKSATFLAGTTTFSLF